ncbi:MAG: AI-2E family transporter [Pseudomonadota bacterium]
MALESVRRAEWIAGIAAVAFLGAACFAVLRPFVAAILWALVITVCTWPAFEQVLRWVGGRRWLASGVLVVSLAVALVVPLTLAGLALSSNLPVLVDWGRQLLDSPPPPPMWLADLPLVGPQLDALWQEVTRPGYDLGAVIEPYAGAITANVLTVARALGEGLAQVGVSLLVVFFLYRDGAMAAAEVRVLTERVAGSRAERLLKEAHGTMTGVLYGIIGTALAQGGLAGLGFWLAGVPFAVVLGVVAAIVSIVPLGVALVMWGGTIWLVADGRYAAAVFLFVWGIVPVGVVDNLVRAVFVGRSSRLPFPLVLMGLIGGAVFAGVIGLFLGPVVLALAYALVREWASEHRDQLARRAGEIAAERTDQTPAPRS